MSARGWQVAGGLAALHLLLCAALFDPKIHTGGDSVTYVLLAESLLERGDGYSLSIDPGPPQAHTKYPPGYPALLAPLVAVFGRNYPLLKGLSALFTAGSVLIFCLWVGREGERGDRRWRPAREWVWMALAFAALGGVVDYSRWMLSEAPFLFFTALALWMLREDRGDERIGRPFALGLIAAVAAFHIRSMGALLLVGASLAYLLRREWRKFLIHGVLGAGLALPWLVRNRLLGGAANPYLEEFLLANIYTPETGRLGFGGMVGRVFENVWDYSTVELPRAIAGSDGGWSGHFLVAVLAVGACALALWGLLRALRRGPDAAALYFALSCGAILLFQSSVNDVRYLVPLLPLVLIYAADGAEALGGRLRRLGGRAKRLGGRAAVAVAALLAAVSLASQAARIPANAEMLARYAAGDRHAGYSSAWRRFFEAAEWAGRNTEPDAVAMVRKPRLFHALTGRRSLIYPFSTDGDSVLRAALATDFVVLDAIFPTTVLYLLPALASDADRFRALHQTPEPTTLILGVVDAPRPPD